MSCQRSDRVNLKGCRIGDVAMRGCSRGCCPYPDDKISENIRHHLIRQSPPSHIERTTTHPLGRNELYYDKCQSSYRPKLICPKKDCRRGIKPVYDPDRNEYMISETQGWSVRPLKGINKDFDEARRNSKRIESSCKSLKAQENSEWKKRQLVIEKYGRVWSQERYGYSYSDVKGEGSMNDWELEYLRMNDPESWWLELIQLPATYDPKGINRKRCPGCGGGAVLVGSNFRIPKKIDDMAWRKIEEMVENGEDMLAKFSPCPTVDQHKEMVDEAVRLLKRAATSSQWEEEKKLRIASVRSSLEK